MYEVILSVPPFYTAPVPLPTSLLAAESPDDDILLPSDDEPPADSGARSLITEPASDDAAGERFDRWLANAIPSLSRSRLKALIDDGCVFMGGAVVRDQSARVKPGQVATVEVPASIADRPEPQDIPLVIAYEDEHLIVIDKPAGMVVHPAPGSADRTLVNALLHHCAGSLSGIGGVRRPGIVHRIDKDTSGLIVAAKNDAAHAGLAAQFADHSIERAYYALVWGRPSPKEGTIEGNIGRSPNHRQKMAVVERGGRHAVTHYRVVESFGTGASSLVECRLETGRTHQIRVHLTSCGHALVGDALYGRAPPGRRLVNVAPEAIAALTGFGRQALHAAELGFIHPITGEEIFLTSELPDDMATLIEAARIKKETRSTKDDLYR